MATLTIEQQVEIARLLGFDNPRHATHAQVFERARELAALKRDRREYADPDADEVIDRAIGRGAISASGRDTWRRRYRENPTLTSEILGSLRGDPERGVIATSEVP